MFLPPGDGFGARLRCIDRQLESWSRAGFRSIDWPVGLQSHLVGAPGGEVRSVLKGREGSRGRSKQALK